MTTIIYDKSQIDNMLEDVNYNDLSNVVKQICIIKKLNYNNVSNIRLIENRFYCTKIIFEID